MLSGSFNVGDTNHDNLLEPGETWVFTASGTATAGQYSNIGTATGTPPTGPNVTATNPDHYYGTLSIGDFVWNDTNANGIQNSGEPGINGVLVDLKNSSGTIIATTTTGNNPVGGAPGYYQFSGLLQGSYTVVIDSSNFASGGPLAGDTATLSNAPGSTTANDSNGSPASVTLSTANDETIDFGYIKPTPPQITVVKTADQTSILAGQTAGFTVTITNNGTATDTGVTLTDHLPPGTATDINWTIDTSNTGLGAGTNPGAFLITGTGPTQSQSLGLSSSFVSGGDSLAPGQSISVHITSATNSGDASGFSSNPALNVGGLAGYAVLYEGTGNLSIANDTVAGNIGVGNGGKVQFSGPGTINGRVDFASANSGQYHNTNGSNVGPTSVNYNVSAVTTAISAINSLSTTLGALTGTNLSIGGNSQTVNESSGVLQTSGGVTYRVFNVTSYGMTANNNLTIVGDGSGDPVLFNVEYNGNSNINGGVLLAGTGLSADQIVWNFTSSNQNVQMAANKGTFVGVLLLPHDKFTGSSVNINGRIYGGGAGDMQIVSGTNVFVPPGTGMLVNTATVSATGATPASSTATITITPTPVGPPLGKNDAATIGFWHNNNGQGLITNASPSSGPASLGNWLATNFPDLYGSNAPSGENLTNASNSTVAALFLKFFGQSGLQKTDAQVMGVALAIWFTSSNLNGNTSGASGYGFNISSGGTGTHTYNVGSDGTAIGLQNNTSYTILQIMMAADLAVKNGTYQSNLSAFNDVFNGINQGGDISQLAAGSSSSAGAGVGELLDSNLLQAGTLGVAIDLPQGPETAAAEAAIGKAIASLNSQVAPLGITLVEVSGANAAAAPVHITLGSTSPIGGMDEGVLAAFSFGGDITLISSWNWYYGSNPSAIGSDQYDFQTVVTHELGHALGLGENADASSAMDLYLAPGQTNRNLALVDLNAIQQELGAAVASPTSIQQSATTTSGGSDSVGNMSAQLPATGSSASVKGAVGTVESLVWVEDSGVHTVADQTVTSAADDLPTTTSFNNAAVAAVQSGPLGFSVAMTLGDGSESAASHDAGGTGRVAWTTLLLSPSTASGPVATLLSESLRSEMSARNWSDVSLSGLSEDVLFSNEGRNLFVGGNPSDGTAAALAQGVRSAREQLSAPQAAIDSFMAQDWSAVATRNNLTTKADSDLDTLALPFADDYFLETSSGDEGDMGAD